MARVTNPKVQWIIPMLLIVLAVLCTTAVGKTIYVGGGIHCGHGSATVTNCAITRNTTQLWGGGGVIYSYPDSPMTFRNCTIWGNSAGSLWAGDGVLCRNTSATVANSIFWGNTPPKGSEISVEDPTSMLTVAYCNVAGGQTGVSFEGGCILD